MNKKILVEKKYLWIPVYAGHTEAHALRMLRILCGKELIYHFLLPWQENMFGAPDYYAALPISAWQGKELEISVEMTAEYCSLIRQEEEQPLPVEDRRRPKFHYTAPSGHLGVPNGLIYIDGFYHLYYQHNPMNTDWANMSWGHAFSADLVHFVYAGDVLFPDLDGVISSGTAIKNFKGCFGLPESAILYFYTSTGDRTRLCPTALATQRMAYSLDDGNTLIKYPDFELPFFEDGNRDPKVFWHEPSGHYIMVLYMTRNLFAIFRSKDLENWEQTQLLNLPPMWEMPDLFYLKDKDGTGMYAFLSADGYYYLGDFDGERFTPKTSMQCLYASGLPYAGQTFAGLEDRIVQISTLRTPNQGTLFTQVMGLPRELTLAKDKEGYYICQRFVPEASDYIEDTEKGQFVRDGHLTELISPDGRLYRPMIVR